MTLRDDRTSVLHALMDKSHEKTCFREQQQAPFEETGPASFDVLRMNYLVVILSIMLADGLQGTHLYVLYESYGFSVSSLYSLGFVTGAVMTPLTGPFIDKFGRKTSAIWYCILEIAINMLEQYPFLAGLVVSRMVGGVTTNLLSTVFEAWLDTESRRLSLEKEKYEIIIRDSVIISNLAAIASGYLAHLLANSNGPKGPFQGAVSCTFLALVTILALWTENYGAATPAIHQESKDTTTTSSSRSKAKGIKSYMTDAVTAFRSDTRVLQVGIIQGLSIGCLQVFIFLWSPTLKKFAQSSKYQLGRDQSGEPAYGLIFGSYMAAGVLGGLLSPLLRKAYTAKNGTESSITMKIDSEGEQQQHHTKALLGLTTAGYVICAMLLLVPYTLDPNNETSFIIALVGFILFEVVIGILLPYEGVIRSFYLPCNARATIMSLPRMIVNIVVSLGVLLTNQMSHQSAFAALSCVMIIAAYLQSILLSSVTSSSSSNKNNNSNNNNNIFFTNKAMTLQRETSITTTTSSSTEMYDYDDLYDEYIDITQSLLCQGGKEKQKEQ